MLDYDKNQKEVILKIFIAGPRAIKSLDKNIINKIDNICKKNYEIIVGDADGIDSSVQEYLSQRKYKNVKLYASNGIARNNYGNWRVENVEVDSNIKGFDFYAQKDLQMVKDADIGFMIWNGKSKGTFNNMVNLLNMKKEVILYYIIDKKFYKISNEKELSKFLSANVKLDNKLLKVLDNAKKSKFEQVCLF